MIAQLAHDAVVSVHELEQPEFFTLKKESSNRAGGRGFVACTSTICGASSAAGCSNRAPASTTFAISSSMRISRRRGVIARARRCVSEKALAHMEGDPMRTPFAHAPAAAPAHEQNTASSDAPKLLIQ
jgi:hypothetical protein